MELEPSRADGTDKVGAAREKMTQTGEGTTRCACWGTHACPQVPVLGAMDGSLSAGSPVPKGDGDGEGRKLARISPFSVPQTTFPAGIFFAICGWGRQSER